MINPEIIKEYGIESDRFYRGLCEILNGLERDSLYANGHCKNEQVKGIPNCVLSDVPEFVVPINSKLIEFTVKSNLNSILLCYEKKKMSGIKVWIDDDARDNSRDIILMACDEKIRYLCHNLFDSDKKEKQNDRMLLLMFLCQYIKIKSGRTVGEAYNLTDVALMDMYPDKLKESVALVLRVRQDLLCSFGTEVWRAGWDKIWNEDHIIKLLDYEELTVLRNPEHMEAFCKD